MVRVAIDVSSGDHGAEVILRGFLRAQKSPVPFYAYLCGDESEIIATLKNLHIDLSQRNRQWSIVHCPQSIGLPSPSKAWKNAAQSSIVRCIMLQKQRKVAASISAGDTAVLMSTALFLLGRSTGISRPALAALLPTVSGRPTLLLDVGANLCCRANHLVDFAISGHNYQRRTLGCVNPSVALLNVGHEETKGTPAVKEAHRILKVRCKGYRGFVEGSTILAGTTDVIVCDGFTGNALLKTYGSMQKLISSVLGNSKKVVSTLAKKMQVLSSEYYGAAPLLGIKGRVFKAHGSSSEIAIANALIMIINDATLRPKN